MNEDIECLFRITVDSLDYDGCNVPVWREDVSGVELLSPSIIKYQVGEYVLMVRRGAFLSPLERDGHVYKTIFVQREDVVVATVAGDEREFEVWPNSPDTAIRVFEKARIALSSS